MSPSRKLTFNSWPVICERMATDEYGSAEPMTRISIGIGFCTTAAVVTGTAGGPPLAPSAASPAELSAVQAAVDASTRAATMIRTNLMKGPRVRLLSLLILFERRPRAAHLRPNGLAQESG